MLCHLAEALCPFSSLHVASAWQPLQAVVDSRVEESSTYQARKPGNFSRKPEGYETNEMEVSTRMIEGGVSNFCLG